MNILLDEQDLKDLLSGKVVSFNLPREAGINLNVALADIGMDRIFVATQEALLDYMTKVQGEGE